MSSSIKLCRVCGTELLDNNWYPSGQYYRSYICISCDKKQGRTYYLFNKDKIKKRERERYKKNSKVQQLRKERQNEQYRINPTFRQQKKDYGLYRRKTIKEDIISHYSPDLKCIKCGFADIRALSIDHINGGGLEHIRQLMLQHHTKGSINFYWWLKKNNYPEGYQVLCMNCQFIKRFENKECRKKALIV